MWRRSSPKKLEADLDQVRLDGAAFDRQETTLGLVCVAAPLFIRGRGVVGAMSVAGDADRLKPELMAFAVRTAALTLSRQLTVDYALLSPGPPPRAVSRREPADR
jgi:IclR family acetate operon transcriptional repressor